MIPGTVLFDPSFEFHDGDKSPKLFILLTDAVNGSFLAVRTTSKCRHKNRKAGCQIDDNPPNFYLPENSCAFPSETWILLDDTYEFKPYDLTQSVKLGSIQQKFCLDKSELIELLFCAMDSQDISQVHLDRLVTTRNALG